MKYRVIFSMFLLAGCADTYLDREERDVTARGSITPATSLAEQSNFAQGLSKGYMRAGRATANAQDVASFVVVVAAATAVAGVIADIGETAIANRAVAATVVETGARRTVPQKSIAAIYTGSKRLNCISTMSAVGVQLLASEGATTKLTAQAITFGAIQEVMIATREGLTRDVADYSALVTEFTDASDSPERKTVGNAFREGQQEPVNVDLINKYLALLSNCLGNGSQETAQIKAK